MTKDYIEFQDRSSPLAYLITIRCYGTWLHGDERTSTNRKDNIFGTQKIPPNKNLNYFEISQLKSPVMKLDGYQRPVVENAIREVCVYRRYELFALQARSNHIHCVTFSADKPEIMMNTFKAYATRHLREQDLLPVGAKLWSRHGSTRYLWTEKHIETAVDYVINGQGDELPSFD